MSSGSGGWRGALGGLSLKTNKQQKPLAAGSYQLLRLAAVLPDMALCGLFQIPGGLSQSPGIPQGSHAQHATCTFARLVSIPSTALQWHAHPALQNQRKRTGRLPLERSVSKKAVLHPFSPTQSPHDSVHSTKIPTRSSLLGPCPRLIGVCLQQTTAMLPFSFVSIDLS